MGDPFETEVSSSVDPCGIFRPRGRYSGMPGLLYLAYRFLFYDSIVCSWSIDGSVLAAIFSIPTNDYVEISLSYFFTIELILAICELA